MWALMRNHDVMETGTPLAVSTATPGGYHSDPFALKDGTPAIDDPTTGSRKRALPDGEILVETPIPAVVPLPGKPMPPMPGKVTLVTKDANGDNIPDASVAHVDRDRYPTGHQLAGEIKNLGFPFWIAGVDRGPEYTGSPGSCKDGIVGQRPATPPLDMLSAADATALAGQKPLFTHPGFKPKFLKNFYLTTHNQL